MVKQLNVRFATEYPVEAAELLERASPDAVESVLSALPPPVAAAVLSAMAPGPAADCLAQLAPRSAARLLRNLKLEFLTSILLRLDAEARSSVLKALPATVSAPLRIVLQFPGDSVGSLLDPRVMTARADAKVGETLARARRAPGSLRRYLYVLSEDQRLIGVVDVRKCALSDPALTIASLMIPGPFALPARTRLREAAHDPHWKRFETMPVVDRRGIFLGAVRRNALDRALQGEEALTARRDMTGLALDLADLWWQTASGLFADGWRPDKPR